MASKIKNDTSGVGSIIGAAFLLLILLSGYASYVIYVKEVGGYSAIMLDINDFKNKAGNEKIEILKAVITTDNKLNITVKNLGSYTSHLIWLGIFNESSNNREYLEIDYYLNPMEIKTNIPEGDITIREEDELKIQFVTEFGNLFETSFPEEEASVGVGDKTLYDFVDETTGASQKGFHGLFSAQQAGPDGIYDVLTEENTAPGGSNITLIDHESFEGIWPPSGWSENGRWDKESDSAFNETFSADFDGLGSGRSGNLETMEMNCTNTDAIYVDFWYRDERCSNGEFLLQYYDGNSWNTIQDFGATSTEFQWLNYQEKIVDVQYFIEDFKIRWSAVNVDGGEHAYVDYVTVKKETSTPNYEVNLEVKWNDADFDETHEWLSIYCGSMGNESLKLEVWNGTGWVSVIGSLETGWNGVDVSQYLDYTIFKIRFAGIIETSDSTMDSWEIDATFLYAWSD